MKLYYFTGDPALNYTISKVQMMTNVELNAVIKKYPDVKIENYVKGNALPIKEIDSYVHDIRKKRIASQDEIIKEHLLNMNKKEPDFNNKLNMELKNNLDIKIGKNKDTQQFKKFEYAKFLEEFDKKSSGMLKKEIVQLKKDLGDIDRNDYMSEKINFYEQKLDIALKKELGISKGEKKDFDKNINLEDKLTKEYKKAVSSKVMNKNELLSEVMELDNIKNMPFDKSFNKLTEKLDHYMKDKVGNQNKLKNVLGSMKEVLDKRKSLINYLQDNMDTVNKNKEIACNYDNKKVFRKAYQDTHQKAKDDYDKSKNILSKCGINSQEQIDKLKSKYNTNEKFYQKNQNDRRIPIEKLNKKRILVDTRNKDKIIDKKINKSRDN